MALKVPVIKLEAENGDIINYNMFVVRLSNGTDFDDGADYVYCGGKSMSELLLPYARTDKAVYFKIVDTGNYIKVGNLIQAFEDTYNGNVYVTALELCNSAKQVKANYGNLYGRLNNNKIYAQGIYALETWAIDETTNKICTIRANWGVKTEDPSPWATAFVFSYAQTYTPKNYKYVNDEQTIIRVGIGNNVSSDSVLQTTMSNLLFGENTEYIYPNYPFNPSTSGGGNGDGDKSTDDINIPNLPQSIALSTNIIKMYRPTISQLSELSTFMWSNEFIDDIKQIFASPMDCIISLKSFCNDIPSSGSGDIVLGNISSGISSDIVLNQYTTLDCGTIQLKEFFGSALDYNPYTTVELYLPYCNTITLDIDEVMGANINITYLIDILSGACVAHVKITKDIDGTPLNSVLYSVSGNCGYDIPITSNQSIGLTTALIGAVASGAIGAVTGGLGGNVSSALSVSATKQRIQKNSNISSNIGNMGIKKPYFVITRPIQSIADEYSKFVGFPLNVRETLKNLNGFTQIDSCIIDFSATEEEKEMIEELLKDGVIL